MSYRRVPISTPAVRVGRDRSGRLLDDDNAVGNAVGEAVGDDIGEAVGEAVGTGGEDDFMYGADDSGEYDPDYPELLDHVGEPTDAEVEPPTLETLHVNDDNEVVPNPEEFQQAGLYNEAPVEVDPELTAIPTQLFGEQEETAEDPPEDSYDDDDPSLVIPHRRSTEPHPSRFATALGLWCEEAAISRTQYKSLLELLRIPIGNIHNELDNLPSCVSTLKKQAKSRLPLLRMRSKMIPLKAEKQSRQKDQELLIMFDPVSLFTTIMGSDIRGAMHIGLGEFHDAHLQDELYKTHAWRSSIRTTSGEFAHYQQGPPILPSDFVSFTCARRCRKGCTPSSFAHIGRVIGVGRDFRSIAPTHTRGQVVVQVQELFYPWELPGERFQPALLEHEVVLSWNNVFFCRESHIGHRFGVALDYVFGNDKLANRPEPSFTESLLLRRIIDFTDASNATVTPLCLNHPIRGELEIQTFGRTHMESLDSRRGQTIMSLPLLTFIDAFGLYRNSYRSLMGIYFIIAALSARERDRRANVFPLTLGPHGSNFADVVEAIKLLAMLDRGIEVHIPGAGKVLLVAFTMAFLGDMPQQQKNSGMKTQRANLSCRMCYIHADFRGLLDYDVFLEGRYHHTVMEMRKDMVNLSTKAAREAYGAEWGMDPDPAAMALTSIAPALDIIQTRPGDPAHSEYQGLTSMMHQLLLDGMPSGVRGATTVTS